MIHREAGGAGLSSPSKADVTAFCAAAPLPSALPLRAMVADDEPAIRVMLAGCLAAQGYVVTAATSAAEAIALAAREPFDLIFLDLRLDLDGGPDLMSTLLRENLRAKLVVITASASVDAALDAMKRGAADYLPRPFTPAEVQLVTQKLAERRRLEGQVEALQQALGQLDPEADFPTASAAMQRQLNLARQVAPSSATVLICGEPGTGKGR